MNLVKGKGMIVNNIVGELEGPATHFLSCKTTVYGGERIELVFEGGSILGVKESVLKLF